MTNLEKSKTNIKDMGAKKTWIMIFFFSGLSIKLCMCALVCLLAMKRGHSVLVIFDMNSEYHVSACIHY